MDNIVDGNIADVDACSSQTEKKIVIEYSAAHCGAGKTNHVCRMMGEQHGRYLYVVDRLEVVEDRMDRIRQFAMAAQRSEPQIRQITSSKTCLSHGKSVRQRIREAALNYTSFDHVVVIISHEGLKCSDLSKYEGWTCIIDEAPCMWTYGDMRTPEAWKYFEAAYNLTPWEGTMRSLVKAKKDSVSTADLRDDDLLNDLAVFNQRVKDRGVLVNLDSWAHAADGRRWDWFSVWSPLELAAFGRVIIVASCFEQSITYALIDRLYGDDVTMVPFPIPGDAPAYRPRKLTIRYFADFPCSSSHFASEHGRFNIASMIFRINQSDYNPSAHYWSCNNGLIDPSLMCGVHVTPKVAGRNDLMDRTHCTMIYSAKPSGEETRSFEALGLTKEEIIRSREHEDMHQMIMRSSLRNPRDPSRVTFNVFDRQQAEKQKELIEAMNPLISVELEYVDLGLTKKDPNAPKKLRKPRKPSKRRKPVPAEVLQARIDKKREQAKLRKQRQRQREKAA